MDVGDWLRSLGLDQYEALFRENDIDAEVLPEVTEVDLEKFGVSFGNRKRLLRAIASLSTAVPSTGLPAIDQGVAKQKMEPPRRSVRPEDSAQRRHLTVMFCDLVGSTSISAKLDAEDWRDLVGGYLDAASAAVTRMGGHVAKKLGDGIMALFGYPLAQENDSERALRAALEIQRALAEVNRRNAGSGRPELAARIGIETGAVVVDSSGEVFGDTPNIAARVQAAAEPGSVWTTARVRRQVAGLFVADDRGAHELKGVPEPVTLFRIVRASGGGRRSGQRALTPLVGREEELTLLLRRWERARQGEGQFVQIVAEPGLGKSRLIEAFRARLVDTPHTWVEWASSQLLQNTPLHPIADWGRQRFGGADVPADRRLNDLAAALQAVKLEPGEYVPLLAPLLDMPLPEHRAAKFAPEELRRLQMVAMQAWVTAGARAQPLVLAFEDLHWADPTTLDLMKSFAERGALAPLFVVATTRPEFRAPWGARSHHGTITLTPLDRRQVASMVAEMAAKHAFSQAIVDGVSERTGGVPLFVEEVTRLLLERGDQGGAHAIPPTLAQSLSARLDRLGAAREVAMIGAVLGRGFNYPLLRAVAGLVAGVADPGPAGLSEAGYKGRDEAALQQALQKLAEADILLVEGLPPQAEYRFKHALIQDAAYENLLKSRRQALHRRAAETLRDQFPDQAAARPEVLAHHFTEGDLTEAAIEWWGKAGNSALRRSAFPEAIAHLGKAIEMADRESQNSPTSGRLKLQLAFGGALSGARGYGASETSDAFARASETAAAVTDSSDNPKVSYGFWAASLVRGQLDAMQKVVGALLQEAADEPNSRAACVANLFDGIACWFRGDFALARKQLERSLDIFDPVRDADLAFNLGQDLGVAAMGFLIFVLWIVGEVEPSRELEEKMLARARHTGHSGTMVFALGIAAMAATIAGDKGRAARYSAECVDLALQHDMAYWVVHSRFMQSYLLSQQDNWKQCLERMRSGIAEFQAQQIGLYMPVYLTLLARMETEAGQLEAALTNLDRSLDETKQSGQRWFDARKHRLRGDILRKLHPDAPDSAEQAYLAAIAVAREQGARSFGLQAALKLAKLYQSTDRLVEGHDVLASALEGFEPTPEMPEIAEGRALLGAFAETDEVKNAAASRQGRLQLQTRYSQAVMWSRGFASKEAKASFARARDLTAGVDKAAATFDTYYGLFIGCLWRGEMRSARERAEDFLREAEVQTRMTEAAVARRILGMACLFEGDFTGARAHSEQSLRIHDPERDRESKFRFGVDTRAGATTNLALANWLLGDMGRSFQLIEEAAARAGESGHPPSLANTYMLKSLFHMLRGDAEAARDAAEGIVKLSRQHGLSLYQALGALFYSWARARLGDRASGVAELRQALTAYSDQENKFFSPLFLGLLAEFEAEGQDVEGALARIDEALSITRKMGERWADAILHRIRGDILLRRDPANAGAQDAFLASIAIAREQGARSFGLQAALKLAKLYQSTAHPVEAHDILAPALEGFAPTPEMPEVAEGRALLAVLARGRTPIG
jgi:class 3 adenylate cyclase/predicted ATPase